MCTCTLMHFYFNGEFGKLDKRTVVCWGKWVHEVKAQEGMWSLAGWPSASAVSQSSIPSTSSFDYANREYISKCTDIRLRRRSAAVCPCVCNKQSVHELCTYLFRHILLSEECTPYIAEILRHYFGPGFCWSMANTFNNHWFNRGLKVREVNLWWEDWLFSPPDRQTKPQLLIGQQIRLWLYWTATRCEWDQLVPEMKTSQWNMR